MSSITETDYSCTGGTDFLQPLLNEFLTGYPEIPLLFRGDSGFTAPDFCKQCESNGASFAIRLLENCSLRKLASDIEGPLFDPTKNDIVLRGGVWRIHVSAESRDYPGHIVCKNE